MNIFQNLTLLVHTHIDSINQVAILDSHDLVIEVHKDDISGIVLNAEFTLDIVHDIIDSVGLACSYLLAFKIYLEAPKNKALLVLFRLLEEYIYNVVD